MHEQSLLYSSIFVWLRIYRVNYNIDYFNDEIGGRPYILHGVLKYMGLVTGLHGILVFWNKTDQAKIAGNKFSIIYSCLYIIWYVDTGRWQILPILCRQTEYHFWRGAKLPPWPAEGDYLLPYIILLNAYGVGILRWSVNGGLMKYVCGLSCIYGENIRNVHVVRHESDSVEWEGTANRVTNSELQDDTVE